MSPEREASLRTLAEALLRNPRASMEDLAAALHVSRATLHRLVSSRDELVRELSAHAVESCTKTFSELDLETGPADEVITRLVQALTPNTSFYLYLREASDLNHALECEWERDRSKLTAVFQRGQEDGLFRVDISAPWMVDALGGLLHAAAEAAHEGRLAPADMNDAVCKVLLDGLRRRTN